MTERSPEDVLAGILRIAVGGLEKIVPTLSIKANREWQQQFAAVGSSGFSAPARDADWSATTVSEFSGMTLDATLDMVVAYDLTGALGGREWLEENADPAQLYAAMTQMAEVAFPFADDIKVLLGALIVQSVVGLPASSSTNGRLPGGASTRARSRTTSTRRS